MAVTLHPGFHSLISYGLGNSSLNLKVRSAEVKGVGLILITITVGCLSGCSGSDVGPVFVLEDDCWRPLHGVMLSPKRRSPAGWQMMARSQKN
jgi:hypothetical protein